ncbi:NAD-dependent epimerase/dehydratase family protein [Nanoarchaeota archaeon]
MAEKVLITGGAGYLGSVLSEHLLKKDYEVTCLDNLMYRQNSVLNLTSNSKFNFIYGDSRDKELLKELIPKNDVLIPLAAIVGAGACKIRHFEAETTNLEAVVKMNDLRSKNQKLIYPTTNSGYGITTGEKFCTEETPLSPISHYGRTKVGAEKAILDSDKKGVTFRLATVFGVSPKMRTDLLVNDFVLRAIRDRFLGLFEPHFMRNYIHVRDVARAFEHAIEKYDTMDGAYNVGDDKINMSKLQLAKRIKEHLPNLEISEMGGSDPDKRNYIVSNEKIKKTGFDCKISLDDGIKELIKAYEILLKLDPTKNN